MKPDLGRQRSERSCRFYELSTFQDSHGERVNSKAGDFKLRVTGV